MRVSIDLDGTICQLRQSDESYADVKPIPGAIERLQELRAAGCYIVIQTARNMATCDSNLGKVMKNVGRITLDWLERHGVEYDEIYFGKPNAEVYIDDRAIRFESWDKITPQLIEKVAKPQ